MRGHYEKLHLVQIDSLTLGTRAFAENLDNRQQITEVQSSNVELSKVREELNAKVESASVIQAKDILPFR
jgi:hypothetical protein